LQRIHNTLISGGYYETYTFSFVSPKYFDRLNLPEDSPLRGYLSLNNPLGEETSVMRTVLLSSTLSTISKNCANRNEGGFFYDVAKTYFKPESETAGDVRGKFAAAEKNVLSLGFYGGADFYDLKGAVENIMETAGIKDYTLSSDILAHGLSNAFHPGRSAIMLSGDGKSIYGILGEVRPEVAKNFDIPARCHAAEIDLDLLCENSSAEKTYAPVPKYPAVTRDLALVCEEGLESAAIYEIIRKHSGKIFEWAKPFDVYTGEKIGENKKSIAFSISFRDKGRTLGDGEVNAAIEKILENLEKIDVTLRKI
jgi:phenylalanyl-tRNA synthetase beta chain